MTGSLPRCEGQRGRAGVQLWPQGGVDSPASQQYSPGWAQLFLETEGKGGGWGPQTSWGLLAPTSISVLNGGLQSIPQTLGLSPSKWGFDSFPQIKDPCFRMRVCNRSPWTAHGVPCVPLIGIAALFHHRREFPLPSNRRFLAAPKWRVVTPSK